MTLMQAIENRDITLIKRALKVRSSMNEVDSRGNSVLHAAVLTGDPTIVEIILDQSPKWTENNANETPFQLARRLQNRKNHQNRQKILEDVGRYFDATYNPILKPITIPAPGCSRHYLKQTHEIEQEYGGAKIHAALVHHSKKTQNEKSRFILADVHSELRQVVARMNQPKEGNIAAASMTFELKILRNDKRLFHTIPIKVSGKPLFTISDTLNLDYPKNMQDVLDDLKRMHRAGKQAHGNHNHFQTPKYDESKGDAQLINHSEQPLYYYLKTDIGARTVVNRLISELRAKDLISFGEEIKISNVAVHLHSTKTPCGPCETVIAGAQSLGEITTALKNAFENRSYIKSNAKVHISTLSEPYHFSFPKKELRLITTYSADTSDRHATPCSAKLGWRSQRNMSKIELNESIEANHSYVHVVKFEGKPPEDDGAELSDFTIFSSASEANTHVAKRKNEYAKVNEDSLKLLSESMACLSSATSSKVALLYQNSNKPSGESSSSSQYSKLKFN